MKIICIGRNYTEHIKELHNEKPEHPVVFIKPDSAVLLKGNPFVIPEFSSNVHYEVELLVKINRLGKYIQQKFAHKYYNQIGLGIDFTARDLQSQLKAKGLPWEKAKAFDGAAVIGQKWIEQAKHTILKIPSTVVQEEHNYLINPAHLDFSAIEFGEPQRFEFDERLIDQER